MAGRMVLLKSSLDSIPTYWFSLHKIPKQILEKMEGIRCKFFWGELDNGEKYVKKLHSISWNIICSGKNKGGLNLAKMETKNLVLLSKWWWKFHAEKDKRWMQFILNKYGQNLLYNEEERPKNMSKMFRDIWKCRKEGGTSCWITNNMFRLKVGDGSKVKF